MGLAWSKSLIVLISTYRHCGRLESRQEPLILVMYYPDPGPKPLRLARGICWRLYEYRVRRASFLDVGAPCNFGRNLAGNILVWLPGMSSCLSDFWNFFPTTNASNAGAIWSTDSLQGNLVPLGFLAVVPSSCWWGSANNCCSSNTHPPASALRIQRAANNKCPDSFFFLVDAGIQAQGHASSVLLQPWRPTANKPGPPLPSSCSYLPSIRP